MLAPELVRPAHLWVPDHASTAGPEACDLAAEVGLVLDPEQMLAVDSILAEAPQGRWSALEGVVIAPRQNIKTFVFEVVSLADIYLFDAELVVWTAHEFNTAMEAFRDFKLLIEGSALLSRRVKKIVEANGDEGVEFMSGQRLRFKARTKSGGRGLTGDRVILDEAFALQPGHMGSLMPTMSAKSVSGNPQILYGSSAGQVGSAVLRSLRDRGRKGGDPSLVYIEWCADEGDCETDGCDHHYGIDGCVLDDQERWQQANLAMGRRISVDFIATERRSLPPEEFARERLGWWDEPADVTAAVPLELWGLCANRDAELADPVVLTVDVAPGQVSATIVATSSSVHVVENGAGSSWVPSRVASLIAEKSVTVVGVDGTGPAAALIPDLERPVVQGGAGLDIATKSNPAGMLHVIDGREMAQACEALLSAVLDRRFVHRDQAVLNAAVEGAYRRQFGDSWRWSRRDSTVDISPLVAATEGWWLANVASAGGDFLF